MPSDTRYHRHPTPVGDLLLTWRGGALTGLHFPTSERDAGQELEGTPDPAPFDGVRRQLDEYFAGDRIRFDLPLAPRGTVFQMKVWAALREIPYGEAVSYGEVARRIGSPRAVRGVGGANGRNPIAIVIPCHRVVAADGSLGGYGGGSDRKRFLLGLEGWASLEGPISGGPAPR
jgi:methylated-DNA-[protein]-cysteine S-methyltransferase